MPPSSAKKRELWALDHPSVAGVYFGVFFSLAVAIPAALLGSVALGAVVVPVVGIPSGMFFAKGIRAEGYAAPSLGVSGDHGILDRFSDRFLFWTMVVLSISFVASASDLVTGDQNRWRAAGSAGLAAVFAFRSGVERRRRRTGLRP